ncbi:hypothetical protein BJX64DRAFT_262312 [Aspergillus heterothallicus]
MEAQEIDRLANLCPDLIELRVQIKRSGGNAAELDKYQALGRLRLLRTLVLDFHCDSRLQPTSNEPAAPKEQVLINAAIDEALATKIWYLITSQQPVQHLENLHCIPFSQTFFSAPLQFAIARVGRSYLVRRSSSLLPRGIKIAEIGAEEREVYMRQLSPYLHGLIM